MQQVGSIENLLLIRGSVDSTGAIKAGSGFKVVPLDTGIYLIVFNSAFSARPTVVVTQDFLDSDNINSDGGDTRDNVIVIAVLNDRVKIKTGANTGGAANRSFEFIAVGPG